MSLMKVDERERHDGSVDSSTEGETRAEKTHSEVANPTVYDILALSGLVLLDILLQHTTVNKISRRTKPNGKEERRRTWVKLVKPMASVRSWNCTEAIHEVRDSEWRVSRPPSSRREKAER
jgi:hypothetical protein